MSLSPEFEEEDTSMSKVLNNEGMLGKILERLQSPTCLVRAALTSRSWLGNASSQATICDFRWRQSPKLLGIYVTSECMISLPEFVLLPDASSPELEATFRHGNFSFDGMNHLSLRVWDCRNDRVLFGFGASIFSSLVPAMKMPLGCPGGAIAVFPPLPLPQGWPESPHAMLLPDEEGDKASYYRVDIFNNGNHVGANVFALREGSWTCHFSALVYFSRPPESIPEITVLMRGKIYMLAMAGYVLVLDLATNRFSTFDLPAGVEFDNTDPSNLGLSRGDGNVLYLVHRNEDKLTVWFKSMADCSGGGWSRRDTICLREACGHIKDLVLGPKDGHGVGVIVVGVGDNAEFVFLELEHVETGIIVCIHVESRKAKVVYKRDPLNDMDLRVYPFMTIWSPIFPELDAAPAE